MRQYAILSNLCQIDMRFDSAEELLDYVRNLPPTHEQRIEKAQDALEDAELHTIQLRRRVDELQEELDNALDSEYRAHAKLYAIKEEHDTEAGELMAYWKYLGHEPHLWDAAHVAGINGGWSYPYLFGYVGNKHGKLDTTEFEQPFYDSFADEQELQRLIDDMRNAIVWDEE